MQPSNQPLRNPSQQPQRNPSIQPFSFPTDFPSCRPGGQPTRNPNSRPTYQPQDNPSEQPSRQPSKQPTSNPSLQPIKLPTVFPSKIPTKQPLSNPTTQPTLEPFYKSTGQPSRIPTKFPSKFPTNQPAMNPTNQPSSQPNGLPSKQPILHPSNLPSNQPSVYPSKQPYSIPSKQPSIQPGSFPTRNPISIPSHQPSQQPFHLPSSFPSSQPSVQPTHQPSHLPTYQYTQYPTLQPSSKPTFQPLSGPSLQPIILPTVLPSIQPFQNPSKQPTNQPLSSPSRQPFHHPSSLPSNQPYPHPSQFPSLMPSVNPSKQPQHHPTIIPSNQPSEKPSFHPSSQPSLSPVFKPTLQPSHQPTTIPTKQPKYFPTLSPSLQPSAIPSSQPIAAPSSKPTYYPIVFPSSDPSLQPSSIPTTQPIRFPSDHPSNHPSLIPISFPSKNPSNQPSFQPWILPTSFPSISPSSQPTSQPINRPSLIPTISPTDQPSCKPTVNPTDQPSTQPKNQPSKSPSSKPSCQPYIKPSKQPFLIPSGQPSNQPACRPSKSPTEQPTFTPINLPSSQPNLKPSLRPSQKPSNQPTQQPIYFPSASPSRQPSHIPTNQPLHNPNVLPSIQPSCQPSKQPVCKPTLTPSVRPTRLPNIYPTNQPIISPSMRPSSQPSSQPLKLPTKQPSSQPSKQPLYVPSSHPSLKPSKQPVQLPTEQPTFQPSIQPSSQPNSTPTRQPSIQPLVKPTKLPTCQPSMQPLGYPSLQPESVPSNFPSENPSRQPIKQPSNQPTLHPINIPSNQPTTQPSLQPFGKPLVNPTKQPSRRPSKQPSSQPLRKPSKQPIRVPSTDPSRQPSSGPSNPTLNPSSRPSMVPNSMPSLLPTVIPSIFPSSKPTKEPSQQPSNQPNIIPSNSPTSQPSVRPTNQPLSRPSLQPFRVPTSQPLKRPISQPSTQPFRKPSRQPYCRPSNQPSTKPSLKPSSSVPTKCPTSHPSKYPLTSNPTFKGQTNKPIVINPTIKPTTSNLLPFRNDSTYQYFVERKIQLSSFPSTFVFSNYMYDGFNVDGMCNNWIEFFDSTIQVPIQSIYYSSLTLEFITHDLASDMIKYVNTTCSNRNIVGNIVKNLLSGSRYDVNCGDALWRVFTCNSVSILCINCKYSCSNSVACPGKSSIINPCYNCGNKLAVGSFLNLRYSFDILYPEILSNLSWVVQSNNIQISTVLSKPGNIYCSAVQKSLTIVSVADIKNRGFLAFTNYPGNINITLTNNLLPSTTYKIICYTEDFFGNAMPLNEAKLKLTYFKSTGSKQISLSSNPLSINQFDATTQSESQFWVTLNSPPNSDVIVTLSVVQYDCKFLAPITGTTNPLILPSKVSFNSVNYNNLVYFVVRGNSGCFKIFSYQKSNNLEYLNSSRSLFILKTPITTTTRAPKCKNATLSNDGRFVTIQFDIPTDKASSAIADPLSNFNCSILLNFIGSSSCKCVWKDDTNLLAYLSANNVAKYGDSVVILAKKIRNACSGLSCSQSLFMGKSSIIISYPLNPVTVQASLKSSNTFSYCDNVQLDPTGSSGQGGTKWLNISWIVTGTASSDNNNALSNYLNKFHSSTTYPIIIPNKYFSTIDQYNIALFLTNFVGLSGLASVKISFSQNPMFPSIQLLTNPGSIFYRWQPINLFASSKVPSCSNSTALSNSTTISLTYTWKLFDGVLYLPNFANNSTDPRYFLLLPYSLDASKVYTVQVVISLYSFGNILLRSSNSVSVQIGRSGLIATILGGSSQSSSISSLIQLDASRSINIDYPQDSSNLNFFWKCTVLTPNFGDDCSANRNTNSSIFTIRPNTIATGVIRLTVYVFDTTGQVASDTCELTLVGGNIPIVSILNNRRIYNSMDDIVLGSLINTDYDNTIASWSSTNYTSDNLLNIISSLSTDVFNAGIYNFGLTFLPYTLISGLSYSFSISSYIINSSFVSVSGISVQINLPPYGGTLQVSPLTGTALTTTFSFYTSLWTDSSSDYPLSFQFSYYSVDVSTLLTLKYPDSLQYIQSILSPNNNTCFN